MAQSLVRIAVHAVFSTKERENLIPQNEIRNLWAHMGGIARNTKVVLIIAGGMRDHIHLLFELPAKADVADVVMTFKSNSSRWMRERHRDLVGKLDTVLSA